jgi:hypothetical protein
MVLIEGHAIHVAAGECAFVTMLPVVTGPTHRHQTIERRERCTPIADGDDMINERRRLDASNAFAGFA